MDLSIPVLLLEDLIRREEKRNPNIGTPIQVLLKDIQQARSAAEERRDLMRQKSGAGARGAAVGSGAAALQGGLGPAPVESFRNFPVFPSHAELQPGYQPFLRANLTKGKYPSLDEYLDVQFRLFREDLVTPLRNGISQFLDEFSLNTTGVGERGVGEFRLKKKLNDVRIYYDVRVLSAVCEDEGGLLHRLRFTLEGLKRVRWANSKRLMFGSLLCLSSDAFKTVRFATIYDRRALEGINAKFPPKNKKKGFVPPPPPPPAPNDPNAQTEAEFGYIAVRFEESGTEERIAPISEVREDEVFTMIESGAYFEAYRHTLQRILTMRQEDLPRHERYIVHCAKDMRPPAYLRRADAAAADALSPTLDLRVMAQQRATRKRL